MSIEVTKEMLRAAENAAFMYPRDFARIYRAMHEARPKGPMPTKGGPTEEHPDAPYCKPDQSCCDFCCGN